MIGLLQLHWIDLRLRQIYPNRSGDPFGGLSILLCGDFFQLPPVGMCPLYNSKREVNLELQCAQRLYALFDRTVRLTAIMRQQGEDSDSIQFRTVLQGLRRGQISDEGVAFLMQRVQTNLASNVQAEFLTALRIYATRDAVVSHNMQTLRTNGLPVLRIDAQHTPARAKMSSEEDAEGLYPELFVSKGCRLMLTSNILTEYGLVNGTLGTLHDVVWPPDKSPRTTLPSYLLFKPDNYSLASPRLWLDPVDQRPVIPILPTRREWEVRSETYSRTMFPAILAFAITIHKSQGLTLNRAVLDLSDRDFSAGQTYVAISRVRSIRGLMFDRLFDKARFAEKQTDVRRMRDEDTIKRGHELII